MGAVVDVLPTEVPPVDLEDLILASRLKSQRLSPDLDAMGGLHGFVKRLAPETPAELSLPHAAIAEKDQFHLILHFGPKVQLGEVGAQPWEAIVAGVVGENLPGDAGDL